MGYVLRVEDHPAGILRYNLFGDSIPFCTLLFLEGTHQRRAMTEALWNFRQRI